MNGLVCDHASIDANNPPDYALAKAAGVCTAGIRRSVVFYDDSHKAWTLYTDPCWARDQPRAKAAGLIAFDYLFPAFNVGAPSPEDQVAAHYASGPRSDLPSVLDVEWGELGFKALGQTPAAVLALITRFVTAMKKADGRTPGIYTSYNEWYDLGLPAAPELSDCWLWVKTAYRLPARQPPDHVPPPVAHIGDASWDQYGYWEIPTPWDGCWMQQYQGDSLGFPGFSATADLSLFRYMVMGETSPRVARMRNVLGLPASNVYDAKMLQAVESAQSAAGLSVDGVIGPATLALLLK